MVRAARPSSRNPDRISPGGDIVNGAESDARRPAAPGETPLDDQARALLRKAVSVRPDPRQVAWQPCEFTCFIHFGVNTFTARVSPTVSHFALHKAPQ